MSKGYQLKITVCGSKPPIWRRVIVPEHITFCDLDDIIEKIFGWTHAHLYEFFIKDWGMRITGAPLMEEEDNADECIDSWIKEGRELIYTYDFGDNWEHFIKVEKIVDYDNRYPIVLKSKGTNMIEDCGGIWGFECCKEDAEEFDMEAVNSEFSTWNIPIAEPVDELISFEDTDYDEDDAVFGDVWEDEFLDEINRFKQEDQYVRETFGEILSLQDVYAQFSKENLVEIAKAHQLKGFSKYNKTRLIEWLTEILLSKTHMEELILNADHDEIELFENAIEEEGIYLSEEIMSRSLFLSTYGGFLPYYNFYAIPLDVQVRYKELMTDAIRSQLEEKQYLLDVCHSAIYLYGVISMAELVDVYNKYEENPITENQLKEHVLELIERDEIFALKNGYLMDVRLEEDDLYVDVIKEQEKVERYFPEDRESFVSFGQAGVQEPNEDTVFFLEYLMKEANLDYNHAMLAFYLVQEAIRMNQDDMELLGILSDLGCSLDRQKKFDKAEKMLKKISNRTRKWDYNGHMLMELNRGIVEFPIKN